MQSIHEHLSWGQGAMPALLTRPVQECPRDSWYLSEWGRLQYLVEWMAFWNIYTGLYPYQMFSFSAMINWEQHITPSVGLCLQGCPPPATQFSTHLGTTGGQWRLNAHSETSFFHFVRANYATWGNAYMVDVQLSHREDAGAESLGL